MAEQPVHVELARQHIDEAQNQLTTRFGQEGPIASDDRLQVAAISAQLATAEAILALVDAVRDDLANQLFELRQQ